MLTNKFGEKMMKIHFSESEDLVKALKIKLEHEGIPIVKFYHLCISSYVKDNPIMRELINTLIPAKTNQEKINKEVEKSEQVKKSISLEDIDVEHIFDVIERDHPEL